MVGSSSFSWLKRKENSCFDWTHNLLVTTAQAALLWQHFTLCDTSRYPLIKVRSHTALVRISPVRRGCDTETDRKQGSGLSAKVSNSAPPKPHCGRWKQNRAGNVESHQRPQWNWRLWTYLKIHKNTLAVSVGQRRLSDVRHHPGYVWPLLWRQFTVQPLTLQEPWKCWHKAGCMHILYTHNHFKTPK